MNPTVPGSSFVVVVVAAAAAAAAVAVAVGVFGEYSVTTVGYTSL